MVTQKKQELIDAESDAQIAAEKLTTAYHARVTLHPQSFSVLLQDEDHACDSWVYGDMAYVNADESHADAVKMDQDAKDLVQLSQESLVAVQEQALHLKNECECAIVEKHASTWSSANENNNANELAWSQGHTMLCVLDSRAGGRVVDGTNHPECQLGIPPAVTKPSLAANVEAAVCDDAASAMYRVVGGSDPSPPPTLVPFSFSPLDEPTVPSSASTSTPTSAPTSTPSSMPSDAPSTMPTSTPTSAPSSMPSDAPSTMPTTIVTASGAAVITSVEGYMHLDYSGAPTLPPPTPATTAPHFSAEAYDPSSYSGTIGDDDATSTPTAAAPTLTPTAAVTTAATTATTAAPTHAVTTGTASGAAIIASVEGYMHLDYSGVAPVSPPVTTTPNLESQEAYNPSSYSDTIGDDLTSAPTAAATAAVTTAATTPTTAAPTHAVTTGTASGAAIITSVEGYMHLDYSGVAPVPPPTPPSTAATTTTSDDGLDGISRTFDPNNDYSRSTIVTHSAWTPTPLETRSDSETAMTAATAATLAARADALADKLKAKGLVYEAAKLHEFQSVLENSESTSKDLEDAARGAYELAEKLRADGLIPELGSTAKAYTNFDPNNDSVAPEASTATTASTTDLGAEGAYRDYDPTNSEADPLPTSAAVAATEAEVAAETTIDAASLIGTTATNSNSMDLIPKDLIRKYFSKEVEPF